MVTSAVSSSDGQQYGSHGQRRTHSQLAQGPCAPPFSDQPFTPSPKRTWRRAALRGDVAGFRRVRAGQFRPYLALTGTAARVSRRAPARKYFKLVPPADRPECARVRVYHVFTLRAPARTIKRADSRSSIFIFDRVKRAKALDPRRCYEFKCGLVGGGGNGLMWIFF